MYNSSNTLITIRYVRTSHWSAHIIYHHNILLKLNTKDQCCPEPQIHQPFCIPTHSWMTCICEPCVHIIIFYTSSYSCLIHIKGPLSYHFILTISVYTWWDISFKGIYISDHPHIMVLSTHKNIHPPLLISVTTSINSMYIKPFQCHVHLSISPSLI